MEDGEHFGEMGLFYNTSRRATIITLDPLTCLTLSKEDLLLSGI